MDAGKTNFSKRFKAATKNTDGTYSYKGEVIANDNLYVVDNKVGVFLTSSDKVYTGKVFGAHNEVLMTTKSDEGTMYSYWGADTPDPNTKLADMTIGQFNQALEKVNNNSKAVAGDTIKEIKTTAKTDGGTIGGTIDLVRRGQYNSATGQYEGEYKVGSGITITSRGGTNGEDVKINFSNGTTGFDVAAGSKVEAIKETESTTDITSLKINGKTYNIKTGQSYTAGDNITINGNEISATDTDTTYTPGDNVSISNDNKISATNTTLVAGEAEKKGDSYIVKDTAGNEVTLEDVASASKLTEVNNQVTENTQNITKNTQNITKNTTNITELGEKLKGAVMYDSTATGFDKNNVTLGGTTYDSAKKTGGTKITNLARGTDASDAVNFSQLSEVKDAENYVTSGSLSTTDGTITLNRLKDGPVTITGLQSYVKGLDSYVTSATLDGNRLTLTRNQGLDSLTVNLGSLTDGLSSTDYRLIASATNGGKYVVKDGEVNLTVQDAQNPNHMETITISGLASAADVNESKVHYFSVYEQKNMAKLPKNYNNDGATGDRAIAIGVNASASGKFSVAIGSGQNSDGATTSGNYATAVGNGSLASGESSMALGYNAEAINAYSVAVGNESLVNGSNSMALGAYSAVGNQDSIVDSATAVGSLAHVYAEDGTALGENAEVLSKGKKGTALGTAAKVKAREGTAIGAYSSVSAEGGVAVGKGSVADRAAGMKGYAPVGEAGTSPVWKATDGAVSLGSDSSARTRQITNLAAGTENTDAVNVAQLKRARVELTNGTNTTVKSTNDRTDGHVIYSVDVKTDGAINKGDTNIVTGDTVYNALQDVSWTAKVNDQVAKTVKKDDTLNFINGDNIAITSNNNGDIKISTTGLASSGDLWTAQAGGKDVTAVNQKVNFNSTDKHLVVESTKDGEITFATKDLADTSFTNITKEGNTYIKNLAKGEDRHIEAKEYAVGNDGSVTMTYVDGNGNTIDGTAKITGIAKSDLSNITNKGNTVINNIAKNAVKVIGGTNTAVETSTTDNGPVEYKVNLNKDVNLGDTIQLNGSDGSISAKSGGAKLSFGNNGLTVSQAKNGLTNETRIDGATITVDGGTGNQTIINGSTARIGSVLVNGGSGTATITGLTNKTTDYTGFANGSGRAATEEQLKEVNSKAAAAKTTVTNGKNITVDEAKADDGSSTYTVGLATDVVLGDNAIKLNGSDGSISAKSGGAQLAFNNSGLTVSQAKNGLTNETRINGAEITVDGGIGNQTTIKGSMARIGSVLVNGGSGTATITGLTNKTTDYTGFANGSGRAATEEQLKEVDSKAAAAKTTVTNGKNITVDEAKADDGSSTYTVGLATDVVLGDNAIKLNGSDGSISAKSGGAQLAFNNSGLTVSQAKNGLTNETRINGAEITVDGGIGNQTTIKGSMARIGSVLVNGGSGTATITGLTNKTTDYTGFANGSGRAATEEQLKEVDSKAAAAKTTVTNGKNITVDEAKADDGSSTYTVGLATDVVLGDNAIKLKGSDGSISAKSGGAKLSFNNSGLTVSQAKNGLTNETRIDGATITVDGGTGNQTIINGSTARIGSVLVNGGGGTATITGLTNKTTDYTGFANGSGRAATEEQLKEVAGKAGEAIETAGKGWNLTTNGKESSKTNIKPDGTVDFSSGNDNLVISNAGADLSFSLSDNLDLTNNKDKKGSVKVGENTALTDELLQVGKDVSLTASALNVGNSSLTTSALMVGGLTYINSSGLNANNRVISNVATGVADTDAVNVGQLNSAINGSKVSIKAGDGITVEKTGNQYTIKTNIKGGSTSTGTVTVTTEDNTSTSSGGSSKLPLRQMAIMETAEMAAAEATTTDAGKAITIANTDFDLKFKTDAGTTATVNNGGTVNISGDDVNVSTSSKAGTNSDTIRIALNKDIKVDSITAKTDGGQLNIKSEVNMNSQKITNLAEGDISETSTDAVTGSQLYNTNQAVIANAENINSLSHSLNKLDSRINRVGAGAAALAALHPLDFDPDNKWDFAAGYGNYAGANAVAIGTYYRPNENTMFSIGGSFGGGENMINAGVSFKLGSGSSGITTSKTVMAKKIKEQDELLKAQDAKMKEQDEKIAKLEALVAQQGEMIQQALGKK
ncbi:YadA-like family protein [Megasphaera elsdenii]|uniref:YadA-like family protein n=1 Tax=Megasphaera elsdenii TaxID=907 RepID=UPI003F7D2270